MCGNLGVDLAGILGGYAWRAPKVGYGEGCPLPSRLGGSGGASCTFGGIREEPRPETHVAYFEGHTERSFLYLYADALSNLVFKILKHDKI